MKENVFRKQWKKQIRHWDIMKLQEMKGNLFENGKSATTQQEVLEIDIMIEEVNKCIEKFRIH